MALWTAHLECGHVTGQGGSFWREGEVQAASGGLERLQSHQLHDTGRRAIRLRKREHSVISLRACGHAVSAMQPKHSRPELWRTLARTPSQHHFLTPNRAATSGSAEAFTEQFTPLHPGARRMPPFFQ